MLKRFLPQPGLSGILFVVWLLLLNEITVGGALLAALVAFTLPLFTSRFWPDRPQIRWGWPVFEYLGVVLWDIVVANFQVAYIIVFRRNRDLRSQWLVVPLDIRSPEAITTLAATISLTPGTVSSDVSADGHSLLVHALDVPDPAAAVTQIKQRYEARLLRIFQ
ncbi:MAG: Na+/H+ antiporter subunit E [Phenylobacterium sp.]|jgi:multicomponent K+:H+ antiporter subunit E|uniref:Na+/H+ antiporter subunit E n=1 Tax=Phenylobacterium sp. TaxID=1871053 RepID=UPI003919F5AF